MNNFQKSIFVGICIVVSLFFTGCGGGGEPMTFEPLDPDEIGFYIGGPSNGPINFYGTVFEENKIVDADLRMSMYNENFDSAFDHLWGYVDGDFYFYFENEMYNEYVGNIVFPEKKIKRNVNPDTQYYLGTTEITTDRWYDNLYNHSYEPLTIYRLEDTNPIFSPGKWYKVVLTVNAEDPFTIPPTMNFYWSSGELNPDFEY